MLNLGTMNKLNITDVKGWSDERAFCAWLANDGLPTLNESLQLALVDAETEVLVGDFKADIVCADVSDTDRPGLAVIEVQLGESDHRHLGQVLTYAAGLDDTDSDVKHVVRHVIWIAEGFRDEHLQALDWINGYFGQKVYVFGLVANVKTIDKSLPAVDFGALSMPENWDRKKKDRKTVKRLTALQEEHLDFWTQYVAGFPSSMSDLTPKKPGSWLYMTFAIGCGNKAQLSVNRRKKEGLISVRLELGNTQETGWFHELYSQRDVIVEDLQPIDGELEWTPDDGNNKSVIQVYSPADTSDTADWPRQMQWMYEHLETFNRVFRKRLPPS